MVQLCWEHHARSAGVLAVLTAGVLGVPLGRFEDADRRLALEVRRCPQCQELTTYVGRRGRRPPPLESEGAPTPKPRRRLRARR